MSRIDNETVLAPFEIWEVPLDNSTIKFHKPLVLTPTRMPHDSEEPGDVEYLEIICAPLQIDVYAATRDELLTWVHSDIRMAWKHFVSQDDSRLNPQTKALKDAYLAVAEVVDG